MRPKRTDNSVEELRVSKRLKMDSQKRKRKPIKIRDEEIDDIIHSCEKSQGKRKLRRLSDGSSIEVEESQEEDDQDQESDYNDDFCWKCMKKIGQLLCCDSCFRSFHMACVGLKKQPPGLWCCPQCTLGKEQCCPYCDEECENQEVAVCTKCNVLIHIECLLKEVSMECILKSPINRRYVDAQYLPYLLDPGHRKNAFEEMERTNKVIFHCCMPCFEAFGVGQIITHTKLGENSTSYLISLEASSYVHCHFFDQVQVSQVNARKLKNYKEKYEAKGEIDGELQNYFEEDIIEYLEPERIIGCKRGAVDNKKTWREIYEQLDSMQVQRYGHKDNFKFYVKWSRMFYEESSWEDSYLFMEQHRSEFKRFLRTKILEEVYSTPQYEQMLKQFMKIPANRQNLKKEKGQPPWVIGGTLHSFQIEGLKWLLDSYQQRNNVILADEMGLGKTIQTVSFLNGLQYQSQKSGPFLIIGPATILYNWLKEIKRWAETFNVIVYTGNQESRDIIQAREFYYSSTNKVCKFNALITSYEIAIIDQSIIKKIQWECLIVDEAHRLKNNDSKFFKVCSQFSSKHIILLTGTPLQNNIFELINLIEFIAPTKAKTLKNKESLSALFNTQDQQQPISEEDKKKTLAELNQLLKPHILRRTKADVKLQIPEMEEIIIKLSLSDTQKFLYKNVLVRNYDKLKVLDQKTKGASKANLLNILMSLRLVCNHPYLFIYKREFPQTELQELINQSNKLKFIDRIIPKLLEMQHKMLIFSQFTMMLDLLQLYLGLRGWSFERLDGTTSIMERQRIIDAFNNQTSKSKIFLLSTRAGGLGINLTSADTIIFTDSDFNPYRDLQAISRAHRMGQTNKVKVYRLVSKYTAEERIIAIATKKLLLEEIIINPINKFSKEDFQSIFKESTWELFNKNLEEKDQEFTDEQLDILLKRDTDQGVEGTENVHLKKNDLNDYYLSGFKFTSLNFETLHQEDAQVNKGSLDKYWETFLDEEAKGLAQQQMNEFGKGKRVKKHNNYQEDYMQHSSDNPSEYSPSNQNPITGSDDQDNEEEPDPRKKMPKEISERAQKAIEKEQTILRFFQQTLVDHAELSKHNNVGEEDDQQLVIHGFTLYHRLEFLDFVLSFGVDFETQDQMQKQLALEKPHCFDGEVKPSPEEFADYLREFYAILMDYENYLDKKNIAFCNLNIKDVLLRLHGLMLLRKRYNQYQKRAEKFTIKHPSFVINKVQKNTEGQMQLRNDLWTNFDDFCLCKLLFDKGLNQIEKGLEDLGQSYFQFAEAVETYPLWYKIFNKIEATPWEKAEPMQEQVIKYTTYWLQQRCVNMMGMLLETEEL